jgi:predicted phosphate transport protein (TIGR00153 family)
MALFFRNTNQLINELDRFIVVIDDSILVFKEGVLNYLNNNFEQFQGNLQLITTLEDRADDIKRAIEADLYKNSLIPEYRGDVLNLIDKLDDLADTSKENLYQFDIEVPKVPLEMKDDYIQLTEASLLSVKEVLPAVRDFFHQSGEVKARIDKVYFYEKEVDNIAYRLKRKLFKDMKSLKFSEKIHLRYFALHIQQISDIAKKVADILNVLIMKRM